MVIDTSDVRSHYPYILKYKGKKKYRKSGAAGLKLQESKLFYNRE